MALVRGPSSPRYGTQEKPPQDTCFHDSLKRRQRDPFQDLTDPYPNRGDTMSFDNNKSDAAAPDADAINWKEQAARAEETVAEAVERLERLRRENDQPTTILDKADKADRLKTAKKVLAWTAVIGAVAVASAYAYSYFSADEVVEATADVLSDAVDAVA